ncbi:MAG TPA: hopanoid biosynthesis-associated protein HpnK [Candidatus Binatia bacterium]|jgi:hopanoid biosynthesis associated protein HpnK|nr:hopanoid biosynthesis-associated protein HpnK [Candidatus Binatia bacterium]
MTLTPPSCKQLIVNGDDFGLSPQVTAGILHAHRHGILTDTSLMVTAPAWEEAVALAKATPSLSVGLHLTLVQGRAALAAHLLPAVTDPFGNFSHNPTWAGLCYFFSRRARAQVRAECQAQIEKFLATDLPLTHLDGHLNLHLHPAVLDILLALAREYGIRAMRLTREDLSVSLALDARHSLRKRRESVIFTTLSRAAEKKLRANGIAFPDALFGLHQSGDLNERYVLGLLPRLREGVTELYCHPAFLPCREVQYWTPTYRRDVELAALTSPAVRAAVTNLRITLVSYLACRSDGAPQPGAR